MMMNIHEKVKARLLLSIPSKSHVEIAQDELTGLQELGYLCEGFSYAAKEGVKSNIVRFITIIGHAASLIKKAYQFNPDVIYFNSRLEFIAGTRDFITIFLFKLCYFKKVLFIIKSHGSDLEILEDSNFLIKRIVLPFLKKYISAWLFLSTEEKMAVVKNGFFAAERIFVTKNIVRGNQFKKDENFRTEFDIAANDIILLFTGRFIKEKGIYDIIDAYGRLEDSYKIKLILVGDGPEMNHLQNSLAQKNLRHKVIFTGFIPEQQVIRFYANSDILVYPTYFPEGFPMALFNSIAAGLSVVTTATRAAIDYLSAPENCLWVAPKNSRSVELALKKLLDTPELRLQMHVNNLHKAKSFSREIVCAEISIIIESILSVS